mgnify:CR=1 FL=1
MDVDLLAPRSIQEELHSTIAATFARVSSVYVHLSCVHLVFFVQSF